MVVLAAASEQSRAVYSWSGLSVRDKGPLDAMVATAGALSRVVCLAIAGDECLGSDMVGDGFLETPNASPNWNPTA
jgi:hypothetical protein